MNAFELYEAAFDATQSDYSEATADYVQQYADSALDIIVATEVAEKIASVRTAYEAAYEAGECNGNWIFHNVESVLSEIEI